MSRPVSNQRLFVAIYPPPDVARSMCNALRKLTLPAHRETPMEQIHLTALFLGDTPAAEMDSVLESIERSVAGLKPFTLAPRRLIALPQQGPARLIACETDAPPDLMEIHRRLAHRLARNVRDRDVERFLPHFTLCRFRSPSRLSDFGPGRAIEPFHVDQVRLMRSVLRPDGAEHVEVRTFPIG